MTVSNGVLYGRCLVSYVLGVYMEALEVTALILSTSCLNHRLMKLRATSFLQANGYLLL